MRAKGDESRCFSRIAFASAVVASASGCDAIIGFPSVPPILDGGTDVRVGARYDARADRSVYDAQQRDKDAQRDGPIDLVTDGGADAIDGTGDKDEASLPPGACSPTCTAGLACNTNADCFSHVCTNRACADARSCATLLPLLTAQGALASGEYEIDPDGLGHRGDGSAGGAAPFIVYCDMLTVGGGWTFLPLRWSDPTYWSITSPGGNKCLTYGAPNDVGAFGQYQSSNFDGGSSTSLAFVPPISVTTVMFVDFVYTNAGSLNGMDFVVGALPTVDGHEGWFLANSAFSPVAYVFPTAASCLPPYVYSPSGNVCTRDAEVSMDGGIPPAYLRLNATFSLSTTVSSFDMGLVQGCGSGLEVPVTAGEQFDIATPPGSDGVWRTGIAIR